MALTNNFWTQASKRNFHQNVIKLYNWNREPCGAENYRCQSAQESDQYVLSRGEEQHIADHLAFLAQSEEGARTVSAATVEEHSTGLTIRLAGNQTPSEEVLRGLEDILAIVQAYATKAKSREKYCEELFNRVVLFSCKRIHERLRSHRSPRPWWIPPSLPSRPPLYLRVRKHLQVMRATSRTRLQDLGPFYSALEELAQCYEDVDSSDNEEEQHELLKNAVRKSFAISTTGDQKSLEEYLKSLRFKVALYQSREVLEIDKIARYLGVCRDLIRFSRRPTYRPLFSNIKLELCKAPQAVQPFDSVKLCHVHGEVQLILHYEQNPHHPPSRAIGSSKSACLLCDLFIKKHGQYHVSHSHKRLYDQWTIPDVNWMTEQQASRFRDIVQAMTTELMQLRRTCSQQRRGDFNGFESRAHLLFPAHLTSAASTPSELSQRTELSPPTPPITPLESPRGAKQNDKNAAIILDTVSPVDSDIERSTALDAVSMISLSPNDLPFSQHISLMTPWLKLQIGKLFLTFEFLEVSSGSLSIIQANDIVVWNRYYRSVNIKDIPTASEMQLNCPDGSNELMIRLQGDEEVEICIVFVWDRATDGASCPVAGIDAT